MISLTSFNLFINHFHFVRPYWLLAIFALLLVLWRLKKYRFYQSPWQQFLPSHLSQVLVEGTSSTDINKKTIFNHAFLLKPFIIGLLTIIALAGPVWKKLPQPVYQTERGSVLIMDMSYSMYATDVKPNRLTRARFKAIDLLKRINEGETGLIAYAGSAFVISPLTQDIKNIELLLPSLTPEIMPELGANPIAALMLAHEMLLNAGHLNGDIYWFTDDVDNEEITDIYEWSTKFGHQLNILGVGSESGAPITLPSGELLKDNSGAIVVPRLPSQKLKSLASRGHGNYQTIKNDDSDISNLIRKDDIAQINQNEKQQSQQTGDQWQEQGAWLLLLVLPLMLSYFRRGSTLLMLPLSYIPLLFSLSYSLVSPASFAAESTEQENAQNASKPATTEALTSTTKKIWQNLWQTNDQQAQEQYNQEHYQDAAEQFKDSQWQGSSHYKAGNYQEALDAFKAGKQANSANSLYNQGNALAQMKEYDQAIESYEKALSKNPDLQDAKDNIEKIKQQQKEQEKNNEQQQGDKSKEEQSQDQKDQQQGEQDSQSQDKKSKNQQNQPQSNDSEEQQKDSTGEQQENDKQKESEPQDSSKAQKDKEAEKEQQEQTSAEQTEKQDQQGEKKTAAEIAAEQQAKETEQKHQQLLNKVTDDPYLLLRNKMQLEYQKRKQDGASRGVKKKW